MQIKLFGGPLGDTVHEVAGGWPVPDRMSLPDGKFLHWYIVNDDNTATYDNSEERKVIVRVGSMYLWRFKKGGGVYKFGYVCKRQGTMVKLGAYNGAKNGVWVDESEVEFKVYK